MKWFDRTFNFDLPSWMIPNVRERLRGTPARIEERMQGAATEFLVRKNTAWSIQEHIGHLLDLEPLWLGRLHDLLDGAETLRVADLENRKTHEANHNARPLIFLLSEFRTNRALLIERLDALDAADFERAALHPRLKQPMRLIDLLYFVAEHDDHHLVSISSLLVTGE
jgi:uncharacterized damage-inducible protein DinB